MPPDRRSPAKAGQTASEIRDRLIWRATRRIPRGSVATYSDVARAAGAGCTARQVGPALGRAPAGLDLPWHRVLAAGGRIALPGSAGLDQRLRLQAEGVTFSGRRVRIDLHRCRAL